MRACRRFALSTILSILLVGWAAAESSRPLILLPPANPSGSRDAEELVQSLLLEEFRRRGIPVQDSRGELRTLLRKHRIRSVGQIGRDDAVILRNHSGGRALLFLSVDVYRDDSAGVEVGLSMRLLELDTLRLSAAAAYGATSETYGISFGRGRVHDVRELATRVVRELVDDLLGSEAMAPRRKVGARVAMVPLENPAKNAGASDIVEMALINGLLNRGFDVLEPGFSREQFIRNGLAHRGGIDLSSIEGLRDELDVDYVLTGSVETLEPARGDLSVAVPSARFHLRLLDTASGRIVWTDHFEGDGTMSEGFFGRGRRTSTHQFLELAIKELIDRMEDTLGEESHGRSHS